MFFNLDSNVVAQHIYIYTYAYIDIAYNMEPDTERYSMHYSPETLKPRVWFTLQPAAAVGWRSVDRAILRQFEAHGPQRS